MNITNKIWLVEVDNFARCTFVTEGGMIEVEVDRLGYCNVSDVTDGNLLPLVTFHTAFIPIIKQAMRKVTGEYR